MRLVAALASFDALQTAAVAAAAQGAVLLRNEGGVLPLNASAPGLSTIAVIGPHAVSQIDLL